MTKIDLRPLSSAIPLYAEEGSYREVIAETALYQLIDCTDKHVAGLGAVQLLRRLFESLCLLDVHELARGNWAFVSFPAC